jgi:hypothetical protein
MKIFQLLLFVPLFSFAQAASCTKASLLYSRELFPGTVTIQRAVALSGFDAACKETPVVQLSFPEVIATFRDTYQFYPIDERQQDLFGQDRSLDVDTDQLVNHLVFDRQ